MMTIVVLLILAGVSISLILDNNGVIQKSKDAKKEYEQAKTNEQEQIDNASDWIDEISTGKKSNVVKSFKEAKTENSTIDGQKEGNANNPTIPAGCVPINTDTSNWGDGKSSPSQDSVNKGLVIKDGNNNEWVWVPVEDPSVMYEESASEIALAGDTGVTTKIYSKGDIVEDISRNIPGDERYEEPDLTPRNDTNDTAKEAGFESEDGNELKVMAQSFVKDYGEMISSIKKYKGFYIGRYELSIEEREGKTVGATKRGVAVKNQTNWYELYKYCKNISNDENIKTRMIWGCQWDITCSWLDKCGYDINDSTTWGNTYTYNENYDDSNEKYESGAASLQPTGSSENWKANNIYDFAGNCWEWTQETCGNDYRMGRGGNYDDTGSSHPAKDESSEDTTYSGRKNSTSRPVLYMK